MKGNEEMKMIVSPKTCLGKWSVGLSIAFILLIGLGMLGYPVPMPVFGIAALGLAGFLTSIVGITKCKERAILVFLPILVGIVIVLWTVAEVVYQH